MKIGLVIYGSLDTLSGGYLYDRKLVETLRRAGDEVEIISLPWRSYARHALDNLSLALLRRMQAGRYDVLLQDELNHPSLFWLNHQLASGAARLPLIAIVHHLRCSEQRPAWQNRLYRQVERAYLQRVDGYIFNSQTTRAAVAEALGVSGVDAPGVVAYPAADHLWLSSGAPALSDAVLAARTAQPGPLRLLFVGNLIPRKGLHVLLAALDSLPPGLCCLDIVGRPDADPAYAAVIQRQIAASPRLPEAVRLLGRLDDAGLRGCLAGSHVLAAPSSYEGFGIVYLEGMAFGLPAIATTAGAAGEIITDGQTGFLVPPGDAAALAVRLAQLAADRTLLLRLSRGARQRYLAHPTWEQTGLQIRSLLTRMAVNPVQ